MKKSFLPGLMILFGSIFMNSAMACSKEPNICLPPDRVPVPYQMDLDGL